MNLKRLSKLAIIVVVFLSLASQNVRAQNESGWRPMKEGTSMWFDSTKSMFQVQYPIIRNIPPLSMSMPFDVLLSYVYLDSICRLGSYKDASDMIKGWNVMNDTLRNAAKYMYKMVDYNPIIFTQYESQTSLLWKMPFKVPLEEFRSKLSRKYQELVQPANEKNAVYSLLESDYILRIKVLAIDSIPNKLAQGRYNRYRVKAEILDTLKGKVLQTNEFNPMVMQQQSGQTSTSYYTYFQYIPMNYFSIDELSSDGRENYPYETKDSAFLRSPDEFQMYIGQEAIVFLDHGNHFVDHQYDYYDLGMSYDLSNNALPIINGQVRDVNHIWSTNLLMNYADWETRFLQLRGKILTGAY
ncbi:MAG: hypothetical protein V4642_14635 [Bacteroidota bacterium]